MTVSTRPVIADLGPEFTTCIRIAVPTGGLGTQLNQMSALAQCKLRRR